jgi:hypothetical protein
VRVGPFVLRGAAAIELGVVGHHRLRWRETERGKVCERACEREGVGVGVFVVVLLDVEVA